MFAPTTSTPSLSAVVVDGVHVATGTIVDLDAWLFAAEQDAEFARINARMARDAAKAQEGYESARRCWA